VSFYVTEEKLEDFPLQNIRFANPNPNLVRIVKFMTFSSAREKDKVRGGLVFYLRDDMGRGTVEIHSNVTGRSLVNLNPVTFPLTGSQSMLGQTLKETDYIHMFGLTQKALLEVVKNFTPKIGV
jgi:hypothetical protein